MKAGELPDKFKCRVARYTPNPTYILPDGLKFQMEILLFVAFSRQIMICFLCDFRFSAVI